ncbi:hypothetical protein TNCV_2777021 [Trichonephila clavipes]|nr:hypothetical protein TNCV_2777021 [Trichonephila clavipes]
MKNPEDVMIRNLLEEESQEQLFQHRDNLRREAKQNILKIQEENRSTYNRKRKEAHLYKKAFKDDPDFVINMLNLSVEDRQAKAERQLQETNSQLELEKNKLQQIEREIELQ